MRTFRTIVVCIIFTVCLLGFASVDVYAEMTVYDGEGQFLGFFVDEGKVYNPALDSFVSFSLSTGDIISEDLYFESDDCSGISYIRANPNSIIKHDEAYYKTDNAQVTRKTLGSVIIHQYRTCYTFQIPGEYSVLPAEGIDPPYNLPVHLPLQIRLQPTRPDEGNK